MGRRTPSAIDRTQAPPHDARREGRHRSQVLSRHPARRRRGRGGDGDRHALELPVRLSRLPQPGRRAAPRLAAGDYATRVPVGSRDELGRLAADFNRLAETLEHNETLRRRFMADVSHELRTPLAVVSGELEALEDGVRPLTRESLASLRGEVSALGKLIDDLNQLALADVGALAYRKRRVDLAPLLEQALESYRERLAERGLVVQTVLARGTIV